MSLKPASAVKSGAELKQWLQQAQILPIPKALLSRSQDRTVLFFETALFSVTKLA